MDEKFQYMKACIDELHKLAADPSYKMVLPPPTKDKFMADLMEDTNNTTKSVQRSLCFFYKECAMLEKYKIPLLEKLKRVSTAEYVQETKNNALEHMADMELRLEELKRYP